MIGNFLKLIDLFLILECIFGADIKDDIEQVNIKRLASDPLRYYPEDIRRHLPASSETSTSSRFSLSGLRQTDIDGLLQLRKNHTVCLGCHTTIINLIRHECQSDIIICNAGSVCINTSVVNIGNIHDPQAITDQAGSFPYKGCCDPKDQHCRSTVQYLRTCSTAANCTKRSYYEFATCSGFLCNAHDVKEIAAIQSVMSPVNGGWSTWGTWSLCTCRTGAIRTRLRACNNPAPSTGGANCVGSSYEHESCTDPCRVNGGWSTWGTWSQCTCDTGTQTRYRECNNPAPALGGVDCVGQWFEQSSCTDQCTVNGNWGTWGTWSHCTCNTKTHNRTRECNNPEPARGGADCVGARYEQSSCADQCPGTWIDWEPWGPCTVTCDGGYQVRQRQCAKSNTTLDCEGDQGQVQTCGTMSCQGEWAVWNTWSVCTSTCGEGTQVRIRHCLFSDNITIANNCPGESIETESCRNLPCPATTPVPTTVLTTTTESPGVWVEWTQWSMCSTSCGPGLRYAARFCVDPRTEKEKHDCIGQAVSSKICEERQCSVDGSWSDWNGWSGCYRGLQSRSRQCNNPAPLYNGTDCQGSHVDVHNCTEETTVATATPHVILLPPEIFGTTEADIGGNVTLLCLTGTPGLTVTWYYQESDRLPLGASQPMGTNELIITGVDSKNYGTYTCVLADTYHTVKNQVFVNLHESAPVILSLIKSPDTVAEGASLKIKCDVQGFPEPVIRWGYKDRSGNAFVPPPVSYKDGGKEIDIDSFQSILYGGTWTCNVINKLGSDHRDIIL